MANEPVKIEEAVKGQDTKVVLALLRQHFKQCAEASAASAAATPRHDVGEHDWHVGKKDAFEEAERLMITLGALLSQEKPT